MTDGVSDRIALSIDGRPAEVPPGTTVFDAAKAVGIDIPHLCHHPALSPFGSCRMCVVEVERTRNLPAACVLPASPGMVVKTETPRVVNARRMILDLILANHPADCLTCEKAGDCALQDYAYRYGIARSSFDGQRKAVGQDATNPFYVRDHDKCILCGRCARVCAELMGCYAVDYAYRGWETKVTTAYDVPMQETPCAFCGNCIQFCPVGALTPKMSLGQGRTWETSKVRTVCPYCGVGCSLYLHVRAGRVVGASPAPGAANEGLLCVKGRFGLDFIHHPDRLAKPLVRRSRHLEPASWEEALSTVADRLAQAVRSGGPRAVGLLSSAKCTNEENYLVQKLARAVLGTNNVDHCARLCHASTVAGLAAAFGSGAMTNSIADVDRAACIFVIGSNTTETHPVIGARIRRAARRGARLIVADPRHIELALEADIHLQHRPGTDVALLNAMCHVIVSERLHDRHFVEQRCEGFGDLQRALEKCSPQWAAEICGVPARLIVEAARAFANAPAAAIFFAMGITQHTSGTDNVLAVANLALLTGNLGRPGAGVNPLRGQNNVQGACDMGALPGFLPGYQRLDDEAARSRCAAAWGTPPPRTPGLTVVEMTDAALRGEIQAMYILGENPMVSDPDLQHVRKALEKLDFLVVHDIFLTETAQLADVVLPGTSFAERWGTFTNTERRVQLIAPAVEPPSGCRPEWEVIADIARRLGADWPLAGPAEILAEVASVAQSYGGISHERLKAAPGGLQWPCPSPGHPGTPVLHIDRCARGRGQLTPVEYRPPAEPPDSAYPFLLSTGRMLYHYHTGSMSRRSAALHAHRPGAYVEVNPADAARRGISSGQPVRLTSRRGTIEVAAEVTSRTPPGVLFMPFHFAEAAANVLTIAALDPVAKIPELKVCAVRLEPVAASPPVAPRPLRGGGDMKGGAGRGA